MYEMTNYLEFALVSLAVIVTPGPGFAITTTNAIVYNFRLAVIGILGLALGTAVIAFLSASGLKLLVQLYPSIFVVVKYAGVIYLIFLSYKIWHNSAREAEEKQVNAPAKSGEVFLQSFILQMANPKILVFFLSILPQFIQIESNHIDQYSYCILIYLLILVFIHSLFAYFSGFFRDRIYSENGSIYFSRISAFSLLFFALIFLLK